MKNLIKLNLGCYNRKMHGFINVDILPEFEPDVIDDVSKLNKFKSNSVDLIYASHLLEHFPRRQTLNVLKRWYDVLKKDGVLRISVPDFEKIVRYYIYTKDLEQVHGLLHAAQANEFDIHYISFDETYLKKCLETVGFKSIKPYDFNKTEHRFMDDHSQAFLPHMDKVNGMQMSLNLEATK
jgi:predicted SAM-dependent methyltransferase